MYVTKLRLLGEKDIEYFYYERNDKLYIVLSVSDVEHTQLPCLNVCCAAPRENIPLQKQTNIAVQQSNSEQP